MLHKLDEFDLWIDSHPFLRTCCACLDIFIFSSLGAFWIVLLTDF